MSTTTKAAARLKIVEEHIAHEVAHRLEPLMGTFGDEPEWHNKPEEDVLRGHAAIREFYAALFVGFPDFDIVVRHKHMAGDAIIVECDIQGTHQGEWMGLAPTGKRIRLPLCAIFTFTSDDRLKTETAYYDRLAMLSQLGVVVP
jgi:steroid delta-isomerase-like uncharacterized protein